MDGKRIEIMSGLKDQALALNREIEQAQGLKGLNPETAQSLIRHQAKVEKIVRVLGFRPTSAVYGKSQVGKSYLISRLFSREGHPITLDFPNRQVDFIDEVNPAGVGQEATGVVTRFTIHRPLDSDCPVRVELMRPAELLQIWVDSFVEDSRGEVSQDWAKPEPALGSDYGLIQKTDVVELKDYIMKSLSHKSAYLNGIGESDYWDLTLKHVDQIGSNIDLFVRWFEKLWGGQPLFSKALRMLLKAYSSLPNSEGDHVFVNVDTIKRVDKNGHGLIDVETLKSLLTPERNVEARLGGSAVSVSVHALSALTKEVVMPIERGLVGENPFLSESDFLDFPGARTSLDGAAVEEDNVMDFFLRSKVRYLFRAYCARYEINNLLWCLDGENLEARGQIDDVNLWIENCVGGSMSERMQYVEKRGCQPLACIQTKFDKALGEPSSINSRIQTHFAKEVSKKRYDWLDEWDGDKMREIHFLRNPQFSKDLFEGFDEKSRKFEELQILDQVKLDLARETIFKNQWLIEHCANLEGKWRDVSEPNRVGLESIRSFLNDAATKSGAEVNLALQLCVIQREFLSLLGELVVSDDQAEQLLKADITHKEIERELRDAAIRFVSSGGSRIHQGSGFVDQTQRMLMTDPVHVGRILENVEGADTNSSAHYQEFLRHYPGLTREMTQEQRVATLAEERGEDTSATRNHLDVMGIDVSKLFPEERIGVASGKIEATLDALIQEKLHLNGPAAKWMMDAQIPQPTVEKLMAELRVTLTERQLGSKISESTQSMRSGNAGIQEDEGNILAYAICHWWNECLLMCDHRFFTSEEMESLKIENPQEDMNVESYEDALLEALGTEPWKSSDDVAQRSYHSRLETWFISLKNAFRANTKALDIDVDKNKELSEAIERVKGLQICTDD